MVPGLPAASSGATTLSNRPLLSALPASIVDLHLAALEDTAAPSVLLDARWNVLHVSPSAARYFQQGGGPPARRLTDLVRPELRDIVHLALDGKSAPLEASLSPFVAVQFDDACRRVAVLAQRRTRAPAEEHDVLVTFLDAGPVSCTEPSDGPPAPGTLASAYDQLRHAAQRIDSFRSQHDLTTAELLSATQELASLNEEYRATTEELETSTEELQSTNEELQTMNQELKLRLEEVSRAHSDLDNLIAVTNVATLFLDADLRIKRYTRQFADIFHVRPRDIDRPIGDLRHSLRYDSLEVDARHVLNTISGLERHTTSLDGRLYIVRLSPYRTATDDRADGVVVTFIDVTDVARAEEAVRQSEVSKAETSQIRGLFGRLVYVQEEERRRISRDIHDQMGQQMTALRMQIESLRLQYASMPGLLAPVTRLERLAEEIDQSLDFITRELRPAALDRLGLSAALGEMVRGWSDRFRIPAEYHATHGDVAVAGDIAVNLYRILQEALNNIWKHAEATHVTVLLAVRNGQLTLVIEDDGRGFTCGEDLGSRDAGRLGLISMRERARLMRGELAIETAPDQGTSLFVHVPFNGDSGKAGSASDS
jgi:signal transduction histidine kinase